MNVKFILFGFLILIFFLGLDVFLFIIFRRNLLFLLIGYVYYRRVFINYLFIDLFIYILENKFIFKVEIFFFFGCIGEIKCFNSN